jgi:NAD(P)H-flavin reductase
MIKPQKFDATLIYKEWISRKVLEVRLRLQNPPVINFLAGQTVMIYISPGINRSMSIASSPNNQQELTICWDVSPMGPGAHWLLDRNVGDEVKFMAPLGVFTYRFDNQRPAVFMATGTGIAPFRSFLDTYLATSSMSQIKLFWGLREEQDIFWKDLLDQYQASHQNFNYYISLSQAKSQWTGLQGHITEHVLEHEVHTDWDYYLCGSGAMVEQTMTGLLSKGVPENQIIRELFFN